MGNKSMRINDYFLGGLTFQRFWVALLATWHPPLSAITKIPATYWTQTFQLKIFSSLAKRLRFSRTSEHREKLIIRNDSTRNVNSRKMRVTDKPKKLTRHVRKMDNGKKNETTRLLAFHFLLYHLCTFLLIFFISFVFIWGIDLFIARIHRLRT